MRAFLAQLAERLPGIASAEVSASQSLFRAWRDPHTANQANLFHLLSSLLSAAVAALLPGFANQAEKLSIIPRTGGALGFTYIPPKTEDRWATRALSVRVSWLD